MPDKRKRKRKAYSLREARLIGSHALQECENILLTADSDSDRIRAANAIATLLNSYARISETADLEDRIAALENKQAKT